MRLATQATKEHLRCSSGSESCKKLLRSIFTFDREQEGNDHKVSLLPNEFANMVRGIRQVEESLGSNTKRKITQGELMNRTTLAKSVYINRSLNIGDVINKDMLEVKSPGHGLQPNKIKDLIGVTIKRQMTVGDVFYPSDLTDQAIQCRNYQFDLNWGVPVRPHDYEKIIKNTNPKILEFHLSYKDLDINVQSCFKDQINSELVVHAPELFENDLTLDLASDNQDYRNKSISEMRRVIDFTKNISKYFRSQNTIGIVTNVGGFTQDSPLTERQILERYDILLESLSELKDEKVEIWSCKQCHLIPGILEVNAFTTCLLTKKILHGFVLRIKCVFA